MPRVDAELYLDYHLTASYGQSTVCGSTTTSSPPSPAWIWVYAEQLASSRAFESDVRDGFHAVRPADQQPQFRQLPSDQPANDRALHSHRSLRTFSTWTSDIRSAPLQQPVRHPFEYRTARGGAHLLQGSRAISDHRHAGDIQVQDLNPGSTALYLGTEITAGVKARLFSDLGLSVVGGMFFRRAVARPHLHRTAGSGLC